MVKTNLIPNILLLYLKILIRKSVDRGIRTGDYVVQQILIIICLAIVQKWNAFPHKDDVTSCFL